MQRVKRPFPRCPYTHCTHRLQQDGLRISRVALDKSNTFKPNQTHSNNPRLIGILLYSTTAEIEPYFISHSPIHIHTTTEVPPSSKHGPKNREHAQRHARRPARSQTHRIPTKSKSSTSGQQAVKLVLPPPSLPKSVLLVWCVPLPRSALRLLIPALVAQEGR